MTINQIKSRAMEHITEDNGHVGRNATSTISRSYRAEILRWNLRNVCSLPRVELKTFINFYICGWRPANWLHYAKENYPTVHKRRIVGHERWTLCRNDVTQSSRYKEFYRKICLLKNLTEIKINQNGGKKLAFCSKIFWKVLFLL